MHKHLYYMKYSGPIITHTHVHIYANHRYTMDNISDCAGTCIWQYYNDHVNCTNGQLKN